MAMSPEEKEKKRIEKNAKLRERYANDKEYRDKLKRRIKERLVKESPGKRTIRIKKIVTYRRERYNKDPIFRERILTLNRSYQKKSFVM